MTFSLMSSACLSLTLMFLTNVRGEHVHKVVESKRTIALRQKHYNEMYNNSYVHVDEHNRVLQVFGRAVHISDNQMGLTNFHFNTNKSRGSASVFKVFQDNERRDRADGIKITEKERKSMFMNETWRVAVPLKTEQDGSMWEAMGEGGWIEHGDFGMSMAFNKKYVVVGGEYTNTDGKVIGRVYIFDRFGENYGTLELSDPKEGDHFGSSVGINAHNDIIVGAFGRKNIYNTSIGEAYLFRYRNTWKKEALHPYPESKVGGSFGTSVAITSRFIAVGDPGTAKVFIYYKQSYKWDLEFYDELKQSDHYGMFGHSLFIIDEGRLVVGAYNESSGKGNAYVYSYSDEKWRQDLVLTPKDDMQRENFGVSVAMSKETIAIASSRCNELTGPWSGCVHVYRALVTLQDKEDNAVAINTPDAVYAANDTDAADDFGLGASVYKDWVVLTKYKAKVPYYCQSRRECDIGDYSHEIITVIAIFTFVILLMIARQHCT